jgi:tetratricopeptide (TPR) repeat protein
MEGLTAAHPDRIDVAERLGSGYLNRGQAASQRGDDAATRRAMDRAIPVLEEVFRRDPDRPTVRTDLRMALWARGYALAALGRPAEAVPDYERALALKVGPPREDDQIRVGLAFLLAKLGRVDRATAEAEAVARSVPPVVHDLYNAACTYALSATSVLEDVTRPPAEREALADRYAARALALLRDADRAGYFRDPANLRNMKGDADLTALRPRPDFRTFERDAGFPPDPFAK